MAHYSGTALAASIWSFAIGPIVAAWMETQTSDSVQSRNAAIAQIHFYDCAHNRLRHGKQTPRGLRRAERRRRRTWLRVGLRPRQPEETPRLGFDVVEVIKPANLTDHVEQVAVLAGRGIGPFAGCALTGLSRSGEAHEHRALRRVFDVADHPIPALAVAVGEVSAAFGTSPCTPFRRRGGPTKFGVAKMLEASLMPPRCPRTARCESPGSILAVWPRLRRARSACRSLASPCHLEFLGLRRGRSPLTCRRQSRR